MALPFPFNPNQTDAKSPIDEQFTDENIRQNIEYLDTVIGGAGPAATIQFKVNGLIQRLKVDQFPERGRELDGALIPVETTFSRSRLFLRKRGLSGTLEVDVRKLKKLNHIIESVESQFEDDTQSITRAGSAILTQSIARATANQATQSITYTVASVNISSIIKQEETNELRINLSGALLSTSIYRIGDKIRVAGATSGNNNGDFEILDVNRDGDVNLIVNNGNGVNQTTATGTIQALIFSYNLTLAASSEFVAGEKAQFSGHTAAANDGNFEIYAINQGGNNVAVFNFTTGSTTQGGAAGTTSVLRFLYTYTASVSSPDFTVGETAKFSSHTSVLNDGNFEILALNQGGNNIKIYNENGVTQAGVAGQAESNRFIYALNIDPTSEFTVGQFLIARNHTSAPNNGVFEVVQINRLATNNLVIHNELGVNQAGVAGTVYHRRWKYVFASDLSANYTLTPTPSLINVINTESEDNTGSRFEVVEINRAGFNVVVENENGVNQLSPSGQVEYESRSIFSTRPSFTTTENYQIATNGVFAAGSVPADNRLVMDILQAPDYDGRYRPTDLTLDLS